jgi:hypothetical protein
VAIERGFGEIEKERRGFFWGGGCITSQNVFAPLGEFGLSIQILSLGSEGG